MKCIQCGTENNFSERSANQQRCQQCQHPFVFEPKTMPYPKLKDSQFQNCLNRISRQQTLFFTQKQFYYALNRQISYAPFSQFRADSFDAIKSFSNFVPIVALLVVAGLEKVSVSEERNNLGILILILGLSFKPIIEGILRLRRLNSTSSKSAKLPPKSRSLILSLEQIASLLQQWQAVNLIPQLLSPLRPTLSSENNLSVAPDIANYSFDRAIICDKAPIAQMLIANNFHFEYNCAILSIDGYPQNIIETVTEMLRRNDNLKVYALHDFSPQGISLVPELRNNPIWFQKSSAAIIDIGITSNQILAAPQNFYIGCTEASATAARQLSPAIRATLSDEEFVWLGEGNFVELESFTPFKLIQVLRHAISKSGVAMTDFSEEPESSQPERRGVDNGGYVGGYFDVFDTFG